MNIQMDIELDVKTPQWQYSVPITIMPPLTGGFSVFNHYEPSENDFP